ncbi:MAG: protease HtpX, partial [Armatimonadetes bacterium]|nr:protease HtpX [Armatimonadota bacterium]
MFWKRIGLYLLTNLVVLLVLGAVVSLTGLDTGLSAYGLNLGALLVFSAIFGFGGALISLGLSRWMAKRAFGVVVIAPHSSDPQGRWLVETVARLARNAGLPATPEVGVYASDEVNAFATGPSASRSLVAVSTGLLARLDRREVEGVLGHEVAHIANGDMVTMTLLQGVINAFVMFFARIVGFAVAQLFRRGDDEGPSYMIQFLVTIVMEIILSILGALVVAAFSRWREFRADAG